MPNITPKSEGDEPSPMSQASRGYTMSFNFIITILVGTGIGLALDLWLGWVPWMTLLFLILGFAAAMRSLWSDVKAAEGLE